MEKPTVDWGEKSSQKRKSAARTLKPGGISQHNVKKKGGLPDRKKEKRRVMEKEGETDLPGKGIVNLSGDESRPDYLVEMRTKKGKKLQGGRKGGRFTWEQDHDRGIWEGYVGTLLLATRKGGGGGGRGAIAREGMACSGRRKNGRPALPYDEEVR